MTEQARHLPAPRWFRIYALLMFPWSKEGSAVWWWRVHVDTHNPDCDPGCPFTEIVR
jgi:hypothetical protein